MSSTDMKRKSFMKWRIDLAVHNALAIACKRSYCETFQQLLAKVVSRSDLLRPLPVSGYVGWMHAEKYLRGLLALCEHRRNWLRDVCEWDVPEGSTLQQFGSLAEHLLANHPIPNFMRLVWLEGSSEIARRHQKLYKHLGLGNSVRGADLPIQFTKLMAEFFTAAPDHLTVEQAVRWSQIRGLGGDNRFASAVLATRLGTYFENETYWTEVLQFLIEEPKLDHEMVRPIIEFLYLHRENRSYQFRNEFRQSFGSLLRKVQHWINKNPTYGYQAKLRWPKTSLGGYWYVEPQKHEWSVRYWTIRELTNSHQLIEEGQKLHHCVATYARKCAEQLTSIWSLQCHGSLESHHVLTIQVDASQRRIVRALGKCNTRPRADARHVMERWAKQEGLSFASWV